MASKTTTFDTDYETTMTVDVGYDQWRKDRGIMDEADKAVKRLNDSGIPPRALRIRTIWCSRSAACSVRYCPPIRRMRQVG